MNLKESQEKIIEVNNKIMENWKSFLGFKPDSDFSKNMEEIKKAVSSTFSLSDNKILDAQLKYQRAFINYQNSLLEMTEALVEINREVNKTK
jgi:hypothetical protein